MDGAVPVVITKILLYQQTDILQLISIVRFWQNEHRPSWQTTAAVVSEWRGKELCVSKNLFHAHSLHLKFGLFSTFFCALLVEGTYLLTLVVIQCSTIKSELNKYKVIPHWEKIQQEHTHKIRSDNNQYRSELVPQILWSQIVFFVNILRWDLLS